MGSSEYDYEILHDNPGFKNGQRVQINNSLF